MPNGNADDSMPNHAASADHIQTAHISISGGLRIFAIYSSRGVARLYSLSPLRRGCLGECASARREVATEFGVRVAPSRRLRKEGDTRRPRVEGETTAGQMQADYALGVCHERDKNIIEQMFPPKQPSKNQPRCAEPHLGVG